ncbi:hypothetical protein K438DRAFT_1753570 [Mycena galopus ATCC 62051]|nr:hypothetical protein K438DRAFT_1753570 [Mycena galopus ATCC 62051]
MKFISVSLAALSLSFAGILTAFVAQIDTSSGRQHWNFVPVHGTNAFNIIVAGGRDGCNLYLSTASCPSNLVDLFDHDDGSGRQRWTLLSEGSPFNIVVFGGRSGCNDFLSVASCATGTNLVDMFGSDDGSGRQEFFLTPID